FAGTSSEDDSATGYNDLSEMPYFGLAFQHYFHGTDSAFGLDGGVLLGLKARDTRAVGGSGQIAIAVDSELWLVDLSIGVFAEHTLAERWRFYIAAGPTIILGDYSEDIEEEHFATHEITTSKDSDSQFSMGGYARAGVDYNFGYDSWIGLCVRGVKTNLEFDDAPNASSGLSGGQAFITFSRHF
ncbi:MAG: hypothetical protein OET90_06670, partial [Desulfuromonadales bacterium]|nr:hypothetical protein [Desulfuromonadales bacterium]